MTKTRKTWRQKLEEEHSEHVKVVDVPPKMQNRFGTGTILIPKPLDVDTLISKVPICCLQYNISKIRNQVIYFEVQKYNKGELIDEK